MALKPLSKNRGLIPPPLLSKKDISNSYDSFPSSSTSNIRTAAKSETKPKKETKLASWTPMQQLSNWSERRRSSTGLYSRSLSDPAVPTQNRIQDNEVDRLLGKEIHLSHLIPSMKGLKTRKTTKDANSLNSSTPLRRPSQPNKSSIWTHRAQSYPLRHRVTTIITVKIKARIL